MTSLTACQTPKAHFNRARFTEMKTQKDVDAFLEKRVGKDTIKKWDSYQSDDTAVVTIYDQNGNKIGTAIGK